MVKTLVLAEMLGLGKWLNNFAHVQVKELILLLKTWDVPKLNDIFLPFEVEAIKQTPIARGNSRNSRY